jgi:hypothetical protein
MLPNLPSRYRLIPSQRPTRALLLGVWLVNTKTQVRFRFFLGALYSPDTPDKHQPEFREFRIDSSPCRTKRSKNPRPSPANQQCAMGCLERESKESTRAKKQNGSEHVHGVAGHRGDCPTAVQRSRPKFTNVCHAHGAVRLIPAAQCRAVFGCLQENDGEPTSSDGHRERELFECCIVAGETPN